MTRQLRFGLVSGPVKAKPVGMIVYGPETAWCRHVHSRITEAVWCQRERRAGIDNLPPDPMAAVCTIYPDGTVGPVIGHSVLVMDDGSACRVRLASAEPYLDLRKKGASKVAAFVGWDRLHGPCGHQHANELEALDCAEAIRRKRFSGRLVFDGSASVLARYWCTPLLYHSTIGRPARDIFGKLLEQADYPPVSGFHPKLGE